MGVLAGNNFKYVVIAGVAIAIIAFLIFAIASGYTLKKLAFLGSEIELEPPPAKELAPTQVLSKAQSSTATSTPSQPAEPATAAPATATPAKVAKPEPTSVPSTSIPAPGITDISGKWIYPGGFWEFTKSEDGYQFKEYEDNNPFPVSEGDAFLVEGGELAITTWNCDARYSFYWQGPVTGNQINATVEHTPGTMITFTVVKESGQTGSSPEPAPSREVESTPSPFVMTDITGIWKHPGGYWEFKPGDCNYTFEEYEDNNSFPVSKGTAVLVDGGEVAITTRNRDLNRDYYWQIPIAGNRIKGPIKQASGESIVITLDLQENGP